MVYVISQVIVLVVIWMGMDFVMLMQQSKAPIHALKAMELLTNVGPATVTEMQILNATAGIFPRAIAIAKVTSWTNAAFVEGRGNCMVKSAMVLAP